MNRITQVLCLCLALAACRAEPPPWHGTDISGHMPPLAFDLLDSAGRAVSAPDYQGKISILFFGFTHCPGPCPATLARLGVALQQLGPAAQQVQVLLVSIDPERDTPAAMAAYEQRFGPWLHGLTGAPEELQGLRRDYGISAQMLPPDDQGRYDIAHTTAVVVFDRHGQARLVISDTSDPGAEAEDLNRLSGERG
jgi:protein SCO1/2